MVIVARKNIMPFGVRIKIELIITFFHLRLQTCYYVVNYSANYATILGNNDVVFSNAIVKMKRLSKTSHVVDQQTLFFVDYLYLSSHKHTNLKERYHAPLILSKEPKLSMLKVYYMYVELITTTEVTVFCTMQTPHDCG